MKPLKRKKIAIIGTVGLPANYGGFETLTEYLINHLANELDITVFCSSKSYEQQQKTYKGAKLKYVPLNANGVQSIPYDIWSMLKALFIADTFLILGVSGCVFLPFIKLFTNKQLVVNIDGLEWKRAKWNRFAKRFLKFSEKIAVKNAHEVIADNKAIQDYVFKEYGKKANCIAYGGDHCIPAAITKEVLDEFPFLNEPYAFKVCRIEPENNIELILAAFSQLELPLVLIGNWSHSDFSISMRNTYGTYKNIHLLDPIYNQEKLNRIRSNAYVYVHGHSAGGTNPSLVEAMYLQLPILAYDVDYNKETTQYKAEYFSTTENLIQILKTISSAQLEQNATQMKNIALKKYTWKLISKKYAELF